MSQLTVGVRDLCEFVMRAGDLDRRFTPTPTARQGLEGHRLIAQRRGPGWESEVALERQWGELTLIGRADGLDRERQVLDEVKTHRGPIEAISLGQQALHQAQARLYGWMLCGTKGFSQITIRRVYLEVSSLQETILSETLSAQALDDFAASVCGRYLGWARQEHAHRQRRDAFLANLRFPMGDFRPGQRDMMQAVHEACTQGLRLRVQAPTGIGKTIGALFPALQAVPARGLDRVYFLTARTTGRQLALDTLSLVLKGDGGMVNAPVRALELVARERACEHPDKQCHPQSCPLAKGFYDRLPVARTAAVTTGLLDFARLRSLALAHEICPYYLSHELLRHADIVVGDLNHWFDRYALLWALTEQKRWRVAVLIDEAHHLVERSRQNFSIDMAEPHALAVRPVMPTQLRSRLDALINQWDILGIRHPNLVKGAGPEWLQEVPADWLSALSRLNAAIGQWLAEQALDVPTSLLDFYFQCTAFHELADRFGEHSLCELGRVNLAGNSIEGDLSEGLTLTLRNVVPAPFIASALEGADSVVMFSATLQPEPFDRLLLGLPEETQTLDLPSPFAPEHLRVRVIPVSTRFDLRPRTLSRIVQAMIDQYRSTPGNYLAFFSSFDYLDQAFTRLQQSPDAPPAWKQERSMNELRRQAFLTRFQPHGTGIGFAVLGGAFGEGIDLPGTRLIGAFIATLGLPQIDTTHEAMRARMQDLCGFGFEFTYLYPGLQKVVQAAGRVIRSPTDRGTVILLDERYQRTSVRRLLPPHWGLSAG